MSIDSLFLKTWIPCMIIQKKGLFNLKDLLILPSNNFGILIFFFLKNMYNIMYGTLIFYESSLFCTLKKSLGSFLLCN